MIRAAAFAVFAVAIAATGACADPSTFAPGKDMIDTMRGDIVGKATFDGQPITDVQEPSPCVTVLTTAAGRIPIDWAHVPNPGYRRIDGKTDVELQHDDTIGHLVSPLSVAEVGLPFTLLYGSCQPQ